MFNISRPTIMLLIFIVIFSIFVANVTNLINVDRNVTNRFNNNNEQNKIDNNQQNDFHQRNFLNAGGINKISQITDNADQLMWFLQISDIHISIFGDESRISQFNEFVTQTLDVIEPAVVLASGDLTDAKDKDHLGSRQYLAEWKIYHEALKKGNVENKTLWMDIRGNHDNFNVLSDNFEDNYFRNYSIQGRANPRSYMKQIEKSGTKYSFIAIDASLQPGPKRPFNFIGVLSLEDTNYLENLVKQTQNLGGNYTVWFGHYPTSCVVTMESGSWGLRKLIGQYKESTAYLCGHLHNLGGMVPRMYTLQDDGYLELELGDWKQNRLFRLAAIDHGIFSFIDILHNDWPVVLVTNPKHALYHLPGKENLKLQEHSTHIRLLAFSTTSIKQCMVRIDNKEWQECQQSGKHFYVVPWQPKEYNTGIHKLEALVIDSNDRKKLIQQEFSLDGSRMKFDLFARIVLMLDASVIFRFLFGFSVSMCVVPLIFFRGWHYLAVSGRVSAPITACRQSKSALRHFWLLSSVNRLFLPIIIYCLYLVIGPWSFSEVIDGQTGIIFSWGIYLNGGYIPGSLSYLYGFMQLMLCQFPLICIFATNVDRRYRKIVGFPEKFHTTCQRRIRHLPFVVIILIEIVLAILYWNAYGALAFLLGPFRTWSVLLNGFLWYQSKNIPDKCLSSAASVWINGERSINNRPE